jgi:hypothetical protein
MAVMTSAGSLVALSATLPATYDAAGFNALTYTLIGEVTDVSEFGREYALVTHTPLASRIAKKFKGSYNNGNITLQFGKDISNAGQVSLKTALGVDASYSFRVTLQDATKVYFTAKVMSMKTNLGGVDSITAGSATLEIDSDITEI